MGLYFPWGSHIVIVQSEVAWKWREIRCGMNRNSPKTHEVVATTMQRYLYIFTFYTALIGSNGINFVIINMSTIKDWSIFERYDAEESFVFIGVRNSSAKLYCLDYTYKVQKQLRISLFFITFECSACMNRTRYVGSNFTLGGGGKTFWTLLLVLRGHKHIGLIAMLSMSIGTSADQRTLFSSAFRRNERKNPLMVAKEYIERKRDLEFLKKVWISDEIRKYI